MLTTFDNLGSLRSEARPRSVTLSYLRIRGSGVDILEGNDNDKTTQCQHYTSIKHPVQYFTRRKIRLLEEIAKCRHLKKLTCKGTLRQLFIYPRPRTPSPPPPLHTVMYMGVGGDLNQREGEIEKSNSSQSWVENTNMTD
jgi:hypothetical protein